jgi:hypothetical protein
MKKKFKKRMSSGSYVTSKLYDKIIKMPSKSHETIPFKVKDFFMLYCRWVGALVISEASYFFCL